MNFISLYSLSLSVLLCIITSTAANARQNKDKFSNWPAIVRAAYLNRPDEVKKLIGRGADLNAAVRDRKSYSFNLKTALMVSSELGHLKIVRMLLENRADVNKRESHRQTALILASGYGHTEIVLELIKNGAGLELKNSSGWTALHNAVYCEGGAKKNNLATVRALILNKADVNTVDYRGNTPLLISLIDNKARTEFDTEIEKLLLAKGASVKHMNKRGMTPLMAVAENSRPLSIDTDLYFARYFVSKGADVNAVTDKFNRTALYFSVIRNKESLLEYIIKSGGKLNIADDRGDTPLHHAVNESLFNMVKILVKNKADSTIKNSKGKSTLDFAFIKRKYYKKLFRKEKDAAMRKIWNNESKTQEKIIEFLLDDIYNN